MKSKNKFIVFSSVVFLFFLNCSTALAVLVKIYSPGTKDHPVQVETLVLNKGQETVGQLSVRVLGQAGIPFLGSEWGIFSIYDTPVGDPALEVISDTEMKAYGWCYWLDGQLSETLIGDTQFHSPDQVLEWKWSYAHYLDGQWVAQCVPSETNIK